jgi:hypothetical protein
VPNATKGDQSFGREQMKLMDTIDTILLGSVTYGLFVGYWPNVNEGDEKTFADMLNTTPKIVFSKKLKRAPWGKWDEAKVVNHSAVDERQAETAGWQEYGHLGQHRSSTIPDEGAADRRVSVGGLPGRSR